MNVLNPVRSVTNGGGCSIHHDFSGSATDVLGFAAKCGDLT